MNTQTHTHTHTQTHRHSHTHTNTPTHTCRGTHIHALTHTHRHTHACTCLCRQERHWREVVRKVWSIKAWETSAEIRTENATEKNDTGENRQADEEPRTQIEKMTECSGVSASQRDTHLKSGMLMAHPKGLRGPGERDRAAGALCLSAQGGSPHAGVLPVH